MTSHFAPNYFSVLVPIVAEEVIVVLQQLFDSFVLLIPVFFLLLMIFGAGFYIGRVSKKDC